MDALGHRATTRDRPHQSLDMALPGRPVRPQPDRPRDDRAAAAAAAARPSSPTPVAVRARRPERTADRPERGRRAADDPPVGTGLSGGPVEFERVVPASGNLRRGRQAVLARHRPGPGSRSRSGPTPTSSTCSSPAPGSRPCARTCPVADLAALAATGGRPAGPPPLPAADRRRHGGRGRPHRQPHRRWSPSAGTPVLAAEILAGRRVSIRIDADHADVLRPRHPRTAAHPPQPAHRRPGPPAARRPPRRTTTPAVHRTGHGATPGVATPASSWSPARSVALGRTHAGQTVTVARHRHQPDHRTRRRPRTVRRTTTSPVRNIKAHRPPARPAMYS